MILVVGGIYQGKRRFAEKLAAGTPAGEAVPRLAEGLNELLYDMAAAGTPLFPWLEQWAAAHRDEIVLVNEVGAGVVPVEAADRTYQNMVGTACQYLAGRAAAVYLVSAGIGIKIK